MAYNNGFPMTYQQYLPQYQPQQTGIIWVQGEAGAKSYLVAPNTTVQLWDSENQVIYLKSADASGMPAMKVLDYTIRETASNSPSSASSAQMDKLSSYATKAEIEAITAQIEAIRADVDNLTTRRTRRKEADDE